MASRQRDLSQTKNIMHARGYDGYVAYLRRDGKQYDRSFAVNDPEYGSDAEAFAAAQRWLAEEKAKKRSGRPGGPHRETLGVIGESWYENGVRNEAWKASTRRDYRYVLDALLEDFGAETRLIKLTEPCIRAWQTELLRGGSGRRTVEKARMVLGGIFEHALDAFKFEVNPVRAVKPPKQRKPAPLDFYSVAEVKALVRAAESKQDGAIFLTAALTGLRRGELVALRVGNVDNEGAVIRVEGSYGHGEASPTKSGEVRSVPMALEVAKALAKLLTQRSNERGKPVEKWELVFPGPGGGYMDASALRRRFVKARDAAGLRPLRFHDLRHVFGSLAINKADVVALQSWMGHSNITTTMRYLHHKSRIEDAKILDSAFKDDALPDTESEPTTVELMVELRREIAELKELTQARNGEGERWAS